MFYKVIEVIYFSVDGKIDHFFFFIGLIHSMYILFLCDKLKYKRVMENFSLNMFILS